MTTLRPAAEADIPVLAGLLAGDPSQVTTTAGIRLLGLADLAQLVEFHDVMLSSTGSWANATVAETAGAPVGMIVLGEAALAMTPEAAAFARSVHGDDFESVLMPRLAALGRVSRALDEDSLLVAEVHVDPAARGTGVGRAMMGHAEKIARDRGLTGLALQTLVGNPAKEWFERLGYEVASTVTDQGFEEFSGVPGFHHMGKRI